MRDGNRNRDHRHLGMLAAMLGRRARVRVVFNTDGGASTDGKVINLPTFAVPLSDAEAILVEGCFDHELAHCRYTDFAHQQSRSHQSRRARNGPLQFPLLNVLEDVWIEREQALLYPGCASAIKAASEVMLARGEIIGQKGIQTDGEALLVMLCLGLTGKQSRIPGFLAISDRARSHLASKIGASITDEIWRMAEEGVAACSSTQAADALADSILKRLKQESEKNKQSNGTGKAIVDMLADESVVHMDFSDQVCRVLREQGAALTASRGTFSGSKTMLWHLANSIEALHACRPSDRDFAASSRWIVAKLGVHLEALLEAKTEELTAIARSGREICPARLVSLRFGETNVFKKVEDGVGIDTALSIVMDLSHSMYALKNPGEYMAKCAAFAVLQVLERFEVPTELYAFGDVPKQIKSFDQSWRSRRHLLDQDRLGNTATELAVFAAAMNLSLRPESRKLLVLVTDGEPDCEDAAIASLSELRGWGIESANLFVGNSGDGFEAALRSRGFHVSRCRDLKDLPQSIFTAVQNSF